MGALMRAKDWAATPLGPPEHWPQSLKTAVHILLTSRYAMWLGWGEDLTFFYNDAYRPTLGIKHPWALGSSTRVVWAEIWRDIGPRIETVLQTGEATYDEALLLLLERSGFAEETYHTFSYSPLADDTGKVAGMLCVVTEETKRTIGERRMALLRELASNLASANTQPEVFAAIERQVSGYRKDLPFTLLYLFDHDGSGRARLMSATGVRASHLSAPTVIEPETAAAPWPAHELWTGAAPTLVSDLTRWFATEPPTGEWDRPPAQVAVIPIKSQGQERPAGFLVAALNPYCHYGADYAGFIDLLAGQIAAGLANARAYEEERRRAEALTELDLAKTAFFSNISHEFRTPLTLILGPLEETLAGPDGSISDPAREQLQMVHRNSLRLLKLVNDLLDFSRIEAGRAEAHYQPTDLATYTAELASVFRTAVERAGLRLVIDCAPLPEPVYVDSDMWEKIVLNLLSNALKYTFMGEISVSLIAGAKTVQLAVGDTGTGIPEHELPHLFERFHRVEGARGRTHEGSGIGLSLVAELVKLHGGTVEVTSVLDQGSTFTVTVPTGTAHLPRERLSTPSAPVSPKITTPYIEEALHWLSPAVDALPVLGPGNFVGAETVAHSPQRDRIVLADDNADMRDYVRRLLDTHYTVEAVADGVEALAAIDRALPDLVLTDVMMPRLDGFGLLAALRARPGGSEVPIILLSARAGEASRIEGLRSGADDYLVKPFAAQELLARVDANLALSRLRRHSAQVEREARALAEQARQESEAARAQAINILESITDNFVALDRQWRITYVNAATARVSGLTSQQMLGKTHWEIWPWSVGSLVEQQYRRALDEQVPVHFEVLYEPMDRWLEIHAYPSAEGLSIYFRNVTDRKRIEQSLHESRERFRLLADSAPILVWLSGTDALCHFFNQPWLDFTGRTLEQEQGNGWAEGVHPDDFERCLEIYLGSFNAREPFEMEYRLRRADGEYRWVLDRGTPLYEGAGRFNGYIGSCTDITELKRAQAEREELLERERSAREQAEAANRTKDEFLAILGHELRTPLNPIIGWTQMLRRGKVPPDKFDKALEVIERNAQLQTQLMDDLLDVSRMMRGSLTIRPKPITLSSVVSAATEAVRSLADEKQLELVELLEAEVPLNADPTRMQQVVWNLLINAIKFTPAGGRVQIQLEHHDDRARLTVSDSGAGISPAFLPHMFERFRQADTRSTREQTGLGLGLYIVRSVVEAHGGQVWAESEGEGKGATFTVLLPVLTDAG